jgi:hypothetical protein
MQHCLRKVAPSAAAQRRIERGWIALILRADTRVGYGTHGVRAATQQQGGNWDHDKT